MQDDLKNYEVRQAMTDPQSFFNNTLSRCDSAVSAAIAAEMNRQRSTIELIASENIVSRAVLEAQGSVLTNKYAEGYPGRRYYGGCEAVDEVEVLAIERAKVLFGAEFANVQPHSGSQANQSVFLALLQPGDTILGLDLAAGGHLTHGAPVNQSGRWFKAIAYSVSPDTHLIDYEHLEAQAVEYKPKLIIAGGSSYSRIVDFARFREIADRVGAYLMVDMAHFSGLVAAGVYPSPLQAAHIVTSTTHKTLRGPRGGLILTNDASIAKKINSAVFPGLQGGPLMHVIAAKAVAFGEASTPEFKQYARSVVGNAQALAKRLMSCGFKVISGGTDTHLIVIDLRSKGLTGDNVAVALDRVHMTCNKNSIPFDPEKPSVTSGIRLGTPAATTRGFGVTEFEEIGDLIAETLDGLVSHGPAGNAAVEEAVLARVEALCASFPIYR